ncbi:MAG TPA: hypothetical protein VN685_02950 [Rhizomicrobium sp.]|nr:hypothetical protein [Rhizomicrobium sp.]
MGYGFRKIHWLAIIAVIAVAAGAVRNELLGPRIHAVPRRNDDPFTIRFAVFNPAFTLTFRDIDMTCLPRRIEGHGKDGRAWDAAGQPFPLNVSIDLAPRMAYEYTCPIKSSASPQQVSRVEVQIITRYTRFGHRAQAKPVTLDWDSASRAWTVAGN